MEIKMRIKELSTRVAVAGGLLLAAIGLGTGVANHPLSPPHVPAVPNVPSGALPGSPVAVVPTDRAVVVGNDNQSVPTTVSPLRHYETRPSGLAEVGSPRLAEGAPIPLRGPLGGLFG